MVGNIRGGVLGVKYCTLEYFPAGLFAAYDAKLQFGLSKIMCNISEQRDSILDPCTLRFGARPPINSVL